MIGHTADSLRNSAQSADRPTEIFVETGAPFGCNNWSTVPGGEYDVIMETEIGRSHDSPLHPLGMLNDCGRYPAALGV